MDSIQTFFQSEMKKRLFVILDKEYEEFYPNHKGNFGRPLRLKRCLYSGDFNGKIWYDKLDIFLTLKLGFTKSRVERYLHIYRNNKD